MCSPWRTCVPDTPDAWLPREGDVVRVRVGCQPYYHTGARCTLVRRDGHGMWWGAFAGLGNPADMWSPSKNGTPRDEWCVGPDGHLGAV